VLSTVLSESGADVVALESSEQALAHIQTHPPDVIIADIGMPDEDGYAFMKKVRELEGDRTGRAPAIALTAYARKEDRDRALAAGYEVHLSKPLNASKLLQAVAQLTSESSDAGRHRTAREVEDWRREP